MSTLSENLVSTSKSPVCLKEEDTLAFWDKAKIFEKSVEHPAGFGMDGKPPIRGDFVFYDGPPFATGTPHYGHILAGTIKDAIPRYKTMQGYRVRRRWGWDCHGLPVENLIEKELGLKSKKDIVTYGVEAFNTASRASVMRYADEWRKLVPRFGRFIDMDHDYKTMDCTYTESVWWAFKTLHEKGLVYEGFKVMQICPRCETTLSNFEVSQGYKDITDISVFVKFQLEDMPDTHLIAWTTTPWTLPGNVALAVGAQVDYVKTSLGFVIAKARYQALSESMKKAFGEQVVKEMKGSALVGKKYVPAFNYYTSDKTLKNLENGWKVYAGDFVTTEDGTGIVHIAPAFGADDYALSLTHKLPFIQHVSTDGRFKKEVTDFALREVKPKSAMTADGTVEKDAHQLGDIEVIKYLAHNGKLLAKEKLVHSYPHCWRCETPLLNYATSSWFVKVTDFKNRLVAVNKKVKWVPAEVGEGRFGNWLEGARDWAISRSRFWGAPIPVWKDEKTGTYEVVGSIADIRARSRAKNTYFVMRHGEAENNVKGIVSSVSTTPHHLTEKGKEQVARGASSIQKKIDLIVVSPFVRTRETAELVAEKLGLSREQVIVEERLHEINAGEYDGTPIKKYHEFFIGENRFTKAPKGGENFTDIKRRMGDALYDLEKKYEGKCILIVTHDTPAWLLFSAARGLDEVQANELRSGTQDFIKNAEVKALDFVPLPHNRDYELDLHRPYIDEVVFYSATKGQEGNRLVRVSEVFDCWFESGSMPYAESHYPFNLSKTDGVEFDPKSGWFKKAKGFPAEFIAEGLDQTRGWFYSMLVLGVALFGKSPYENVIVNGIILAEDGEKMAKSKKNFPDPMDIVNKYGADAVRYYLLSSPVVHGQDFCFSERGVDEVVKKHIGRLNNVVTFYEMYAPKKRAVKTRTKNAGVATIEATTNLLDEWILARTSELVGEVTKAMDSYELDRATRPFADFIDDLSTWYIRRSRDRFKGGGHDGEMALRTTHFVLMTLARLLAPFMPFLAEDIYSRLKMKHDPESVHLTGWPTQSEVWKLNQSDIISLMASVRRISSLGLEARSKARVNVRQPLAQLTVNGGGIVAKVPELVALIADEVHVKKIVWDETITSDSVEVVLDTVLTAELKEEGALRELIRSVQELRKKENLTIQDVVKLSITADASTKALVEKYTEEIKKTAGLSSIDVTVSNAPSDASSVGSDAPVVPILTIGR